MEGFAKKGKTYSDRKPKEDIYSKVIRAGKRTYFFDVKQTKSQELYLTITESKKRFEAEGRYHYEKHKVFLYQEDFGKFMDNLRNVVDYIDERQTVRVYDEEERQEVLEEEFTDSDYTNVEFDDLNN